MTAEPYSQFDANVSQIVIESETNDGRFESFCRDMISYVEGGAKILSTSTTWDRGRDGVGVGTLRGVYVCVSLRDDVDAKALADLERIVATTSQIERLYFCFSHRLTEHKKDQIETALIREIDSAFPIICLGSIQLADIARQERKSLEKNYGAEIRDCLRAISRDPGDESELQGLRLALISSGTDSHTIRQSIYRNSLLEVLSDNKPRTIAVCSRDLAARLKLSRNLAESSIEPHLRDLVANGHAQLANEHYTVSDLGRHLLEDERIEAAERFLKGRNTIHDALEQAIGNPIATDDFSRIWVVFEERMTHYFQSRGEAIVSEISDLLDDAPATSANSRSVFSFLDEFATAVGNTSNHPQRREELQQAIKDLFTDRTGPAAHWLVELCASFVAACALGLEHSSSTALGKLISRTNVILDTDVVLSLVGEGEPEHEAAQTIVNKWIQNGGKVFIAEPVLDEVAYHAHIAQQDFDQVSHFLPGTPADRLHVIDNAFVRSFAEMLDKKKVRPQHWRSYIGQFRGRGPYEWKQALSTLSTEYSVKKLPPRSSNEAELADQVRRFLLDRAEAAAPEKLDKATRDKAARDSELYAALVHHIDTVKATDPGATCLLISSARRLSSVEDRFHGSGEQQMVISIASALYIVSLLPSVSLGLSAMKAFLFDERKSRFSSDLERTLIRMVKSSRDLSMPFAKRGILMREVRDRMLRDAAALGISGRNIGQLERQAMAPDNKANTIQLLRDALDAVGADHRLERENKNLRQRVAELEVRLSRKKP